MEARDVGDVHRLNGVKSLRGQCRPAVGDGNLEGQGWHDGGALRRGPRIVNEHRLHEGLLAGRVQVVRSGRDRRAHHRFPQVDERAHAVDQHLRPPRQRVECRPIAHVDDHRIEPAELRGEVLQLAGVPPGK